MSGVEEFAEDFLRDVAGIKNPDYVTKMVFVSRYIMPRDNRRRRKKGRKKFRTAT